MTEQELIEAISGHVSFGNMQPVMDAAKAYADAQVDAAIGRAMNEVGRISVEYNEKLAAKDTEIAELKANLSQAQQMYTDLLVGTTDAIVAKNAEIKRLREFAQQCHKSPEKLVLIHYFENGEFDYCDLVPLQDAAINSLSPAPVTEGRENEVTRETMMKALLDIEDDAHAKMVLGTPLNTKSILMSARHGLGIDSEMIHPLNEDQA